MRSLLKLFVHGVAKLLVLPVLCSYTLSSVGVGKDRALEGATQLLAGIPGLPGQYLRRAFLTSTLAHCDKTACIEFGTIFSQTGARLDANAYVGPRCHLGLCHLEKDVLLAAGVHVPSGQNIHGITDPDAAIRDQPGERTLVRIGQGSWIGSAAVVMADVGRNTVVGAGAVVVKPLPDNVIAGGVPAKVIRERT